MAKSRRKATGAASGGTDGAAGPGGAPPQPASSDHLGRAATEVHERHFVQHQTGEQAGQAASGPLDAPQSDSHAHPNEGDTNPAGGGEACQTAHIGTPQEAGTVSHAPERETDTQQAGDDQATGGSDTDETAQIDTAPEAGKVNSDGGIGASSASNGSARTRGPLEVTRRLQREGRWAEVEPVRDEMMRSARRQIPDKAERQAWVYAELDRLYPPLGTPKPQESGSQSLTPNAISPPYTTMACFGNDANSPQSPTIPITYVDSGQIQGLSAIPDGWPDLPSNASLAAEVGWVQANRLAVVEERASGATVVRLDRARSAAPSWAALGWLETSIRSYAKFVDVAAKASGSDDDEGAVMRRERRSLDEVARILDEMRPGPPCPTCGQPTAPGRG